MKFTQEKAKEIIQRCNLSPTTLKVWKSRGAIPNKYFKEGFKPVQNVKEGSLTRKLREVLRTKGVLVNAFRAFQDHPNYKADTNNRALDVMKGSKFTVEEVTTIKDELTEIRNSARAATTSKSINRINYFFSDKRISRRAIIGDKYSDKLSRSAYLEENEKIEILTLIVSFYNQIRI